MQEAGHRPDENTYNAILAGLAKHGKWEDLDPMLELCRQKSIAILPPTMNSILNAASQKPGYSLDDLYELRKTLGAEWSLATCNIMLKATIDKCPDEALELRLKAFFQKMKEAGWEPSHVTVNTLLTKIEHSGDTSPQVIRRLLESINNKESLAGARIQDIVTKNMLYHTSARNTDKVIRKDADYHNSQDTAFRMVALIRELRPVEAIRIFYSQLSQSIRPTTQILLLAIKAVFLLPATPDTLEDIDESKRSQRNFNHSQYKSQTINHILELSAKYGLNVHTSLSTNAWAYLSAVYGYRISKDMKTVDPLLLRPPKEHIMSEIYDFYHLHKLKNPHHPLMVSISVLYNRRQYQAVVDLMRAVSSNEWGRRSNFNIVALTILLKAYLTLRDEKGVGWIVEHIIERDLEPDNVFMKTLRGTKQLPMAQYVIEWDEKELEIVDKSLKMCEDFMTRKMERREKNSKMIVKLLAKQDENIVEENIVEGNSLGNQLLDANTGSNTAEETPSQVFIE
ncbi:hypothetical protein ABW20_dc0110685 [Dactylellina cionopaga]|nr:hypothetical protein ABW20_dc0110685 [Dactylellina cionopaga]